MSFENFEIVKIFKNALGQFILNCPPKHVIISTNKTVLRECASQNKMIKVWVQTNDLIVPFNNLF